MTWPPESPLKPVLDARIYIEPKDKAPDSEHKRQAEFVSTMKRIAPRVMVLALTNGTHIPSMAGRRKMNAEGRFAGAPDTVICFTGGTAWIEWKDATGVLSNAQVECLNRLAAMDHPVAVCRTAPGAIAWLRSVGCPVPSLTPRA